MLDFRHDPGWRVGNSNVEDLARAHEVIEGALQNVQLSLTGSVAKRVALVAIVGTLGTLLFLHADDESVHSGDRLRCAWDRHTSRGAAEAI